MQFFPLQTFQRCLDRLKDSREKLKDRFRNLHIKEATEFPDNDSFIEELMKDELKCLRKEQSSESGDMDLEVIESCLSIQVQYVNKMINKAYFSLLYPRYTKYIGWTGDF